MDEHKWLAEQFEAERPHLRAVAYRMLGSTREADDAVQEAWLRLSRVSAGEIENLGGWPDHGGRAHLPQHARGRLGRAAGHRPAADPRVGGRTPLAVGGYAVLSGDRLALPFQWSGSANSTMIPAGPRT